VTRRDERGSAVIELVALLPIYMMFIVAVVFVGKLNNSSANIEAAARSAARTISIARDPQAAEGDARRVAAQMAEEGSAFCSPMGFNAVIRPPVNDQPAEVEVTVTCSVDLREATLIKLPGSRTVTAQATEVIDLYRETT